MNIIRLGERLQLDGNIDTGNQNLRGSINLVPWFVCFFPQEMQNVYKNPFTLI